VIRRGRLTRWEAEIRGETGIEGEKSGQRASGVEIADAGANRQ
jgi:hypothetical protein